MTHHVVQHAAALQGALPEPRHVWTAVLLRGAGEIRTAGQRGATRPYQLAAAGDVWREELVLQIPGVESDAPGEIENLLRLGDVASEGLLAGEAAQGADPILDGADDLFDVGDARLIGTA